MTANRYRQNGQYNLKTVELILSNGNRLDLKNAFIDISLYESMISPTMSGNISIVDSTSQYNSLALGNSEEIFIDFETAGSNNNIIYRGVVYKSTPPARVSEHASGIVLHFVSKEQINNNRMIVEDSFNSESSKIVSTLFNRIRNNKNLVLEDSKNIHKFVSASHKPLEIIADLSSRSVSKNNEYGYLFFENNREFVYKPIQNLYKQEPTGSYFYKNSGIFDDVKKKEEQAFNSIQNYELVTIPDLLEQIEDGVYGSTCTNLNLLDKEIIENTYNNLDAFDRNKSLAKVPNLKNLINQKHTDVKEVRIWPQNDAFHKARFYNLRELLNSQKFAAKISVFGDTSNRVGSVINCVLPVWGTNALNNGKVPDPFSGKCLMFEIKHTIQKTKYTQTIKLIKDSFEAGYS